MKNKLNKLFLTFWVLTGMVFTTLGQVTTSSLSGKALRQNLTFALLTDLHVNPKSASDTALHQIVDEINKTEFDFVVVSGDLTNTGSNAELEGVGNTLSQLNKPYYVIPGNHETNWSESAGLQFNRLFGNDRFLFRKNGFLMIGLNTGPFMRMGDGLVKQEDLQWLSGELKKAKNNNELLISFTHYPLAAGLSNWDSVTDILKKNNCILSLCGHGHRLVLFNFDGIPGIMGRAMMMQKGQLPGYNIVEIRNDSVYFSQKEVGKDKAASFTRFNYLKPKLIDSLPVSPKADYKINQEYSKVEVGFQLGDSASVFTGTCIVDRKTLIYGNSVGKIKAIRIASHKLIWENQLQGPVYSTPVSSKSVISVGTVDGKIIGFDIRNGKELWKVEVGTPVLADGIVENNELYIGGGSTAFYKIEMTSGKVIWKFEGINGSIQGQAALSDKQVIFGAWDRHLYCLDKSTGELLWKWNDGRTNMLFSPGNIVPAIANGKVFIVAPDNCMTAINLISGKQIWRDHTYRVRESMGISPDKRQVYAKLMNDSVISVSTLTDEFKLNWIVNAGFGYEHNPCPILTTDNQVFIGTRAGTVISINPRQQKVNWKYKAGYSGVNKLVWDGKKKVFVSLSEGKLISLKKK
jgi:outer membrane protein assembly factor BamB/predicted MPP superfamily phosphohydrolase